MLKFVEWVESVGLRLSSEVTSKVVQRYIDQRVADGLSARTVNRDLTPVAGMFRFGKKMGLTGNPLAGEEYRELRLKEPTPAPNLRTLSPAQVDTFIKRMHEVGHPAYAALFAVIAGTGIRLDEACHLDLGDIDHANKLIRVTPKEGWTTKNYRFRNVPASEETIKAARNFVRLREQVSLERKAVWSQVQRVRKSIGLPPFSPHDLRRAWASAMHARGASLKAISAWLGHGSLGVTERYVRVIETDGHQFLPR